MKRFLFLGLTVVLTACGSTSPEDLFSDPDAGSVGSVDEAGTAGASGQAGAAGSSSQAGASGEAGSAQAGAAGASGSSGQAGSDGSSPTNPDSFGPLGCSGLPDPGYGCMEFEAINRSSTVDTSDKWRAYCWEYTGTPSGNLLEKKVDVFLKENTIHIAVKVKDTSIAATGAEVGRVYCNVYFPRPGMSADVWWGHHGPNTRATCQSNQPEWASDSLGLCEEGLGRIWVNGEQKAVKKFNPEYPNSPDAEYSAGASF